jgi:beta-glucanase (GH16 family)
MLPLQHTISESKGMQGIEGDENSMQAGRTSSSLRAERNSAALRLNASPVVNVGDINSHHFRRTPSMLSVNRRSSYVPVIPSPLNPTSSHSSVDSRVNGGSVVCDSDESPNESSLSGGVFAAQSTSSIQEKSTSSAESIGGETLAKMATKSSTTQALLGGKYLPAIQPIQTPRPETPKNLSDLGRDYSRYPLSSPNVHYKPGRNSAPAILRTTTQNPFSDSQANLQKWGYPDDSIGTLDPYFGGEKGFILYSDEPEADDIYHLPADDDDITYKSNWAELFTRRSIVSTLGAIFLVLGLICVFIIIPILTFATDTFLPDNGSPDGNGFNDSGPAWAHVNDNTYVLLSNVRQGLIDPDTPDTDDARKRKSTFDGSELELVFSDEFNVPNRTFYPGDDPFWTAPSLWYGSTQDLEWYDPAAVTTANGTLQLKLDALPNHNLQYQSGMLNSWNQLCFKGGVFEVSLSLAGPSGVPGLWPGVWAMGNLGRPGYKATTDGVWPYTYNSCDAGITPNQSTPDGLSWLPGQKLNSCTCKGEDHPSSGTGRGAPEIDILEGSVDPNNRIGVITQSAQIAPFDVFYRPNSNFLQMPNYNTTQMNAYTGGPFQQAVSATTLLNNDWYDGKAYQKYAFEYIPGTSKGKIVWFVGEDQSFLMDGRAVGMNGNVAARQVSEEPMSMVLNLGISASWSEILFPDLVFPTTMYIDYVRIYQKPGETSITCDPPGYPTTQYITDHADAYNNPNLTVSIPS